MGVACAACFEELASVFASSGATHYAKIFASLNIKNDISPTPLKIPVDLYLTSKKTLLFLEVDIVKHLTSKKKVPALVFPLHRAEQRLTIIFAQLWP